jgi:hypothetical protein
LYRKVGGIKDDTAFVMFTFPIAPHRNPSDA